MTMLHRLREQTKGSIEAHQPDVQKALNELDDFRLSLKWEFHSWGKNMLLHKVIYLFDVR